NSRCLCRPPVLLLLGKTAWTKAQAEAAFSLLTESLGIGLLSYASINHHSRQSSERRMNPTPPSRLRQSQSLHESVLFGFSILHDNHSCLPLILFLSPIIG